MEAITIAILKGIGVALYGGITIICGNNSLVRLQGLGIITAGAGWILSGM